MKQIELTIENISKSIKLIGSIGSIFGFFYFFAYIRMVGIPFPLELNLLPTVLLLVGVVSFVATSIFVGATLVPAMIADDPTNPITPHLCGEPGKVPPSSLTKIGRYIYCSWAPTILALLGIVLCMLGLNTLQKTAGALMICASIAWIVATGYLLPALKGKSLRYIATTGLLVALSSYSYLIILLLLSAIVPAIGNMPAWPVCIGLMAGFSVVHLLITVPTQADTKNLILLPPTYKEGARPRPVFAVLIATLLMLLSVVCYPINARIGATVLRAFNIGGGVEASLCLKTKSSALITQKIALISDECTEPVSILLDAGDRVYVKSIAKTEDNKNAPTKAVAEPVPLETIFFRQDDIKNKIYLLSKKSKEG